MPVRPRFDPKRSLTAARAFLFAGRNYAPGDPFPHPDDPRPADRQLARQYESRAVNMVDQAAEAQDPVQMTGPDDAHRYTITAPWMDEPLVIRGKAKAEEAPADLRSEGRPLGWIEGGSEVEVIDLDGGWYEITAPWLEEETKVQGREAAEAKQLEVHTAGEPITHHGVTLDPEAGENGYYDVKADWLAEAEKVHGIDAARERAAELRDAGAPEGWDPAAGTALTPEQADAGAAPAAEGEGTDEGSDENPANAGTDEGANATDGADEGADTPESDEGAQSGGVVGSTAVDGDTQSDAPQTPAFDADALATSTHTGGGYYEVAAPWLDAPERVKGKDAAEAARLKIVEAGPPEGWAPASS